MRIRVLLTLAFSVITILNLGCTPRVNVVKNPGPKTNGVRYYRPKPYLLVTPIGTSVSVKEEKKTTTTSTQSDEFVHIGLEYLPDFSEEYAIDVRPGLGTADVSFKLEDGWNLTELNQDLDSQFDENISAIADLVRAGGDAISPTGEGGTRLQPQSATKRWAVKATNIPIGYYEAVINQDPGCKKRLYGWRYIGFAPFNSCPTDMAGLECSSCGEHNSPIYGLVFENGAMTFKQLNAIQPDLERELVPTGTVEFKSSSPKPKTSEIEDKIEQSILLNPNVMPLSPTKVKVSIDGSNVKIVIATSNTSMEQRTTAAAAATQDAQTILKDQEISGAMITVEFEPSTTSPQETSASYNPSIKGINFGHSVSTLATPSSTPARVWTGRGR